MIKILNSFILISNILERIRPDKISISSQRSENSRTSQHYEKPMSTRFPYLEFFKLSFDGVKKEEKIQRITTFLLLSSYLVNYKISVFFTKFKAWINLMLKNTMILIRDLKTQVWWWMWRHYFMILPTHQAPRSHPFDLTISNPLIVFF